MAGAPHDILVLTLKERPELLAELLQRVAGKPFHGPIHPVDSAVRFAASLETQPDLVFTTPAPGSPWFVVEVQRRKDERKGRSWHLATSVLLQHGTMGDLIVITASRAVARWALEVAQHRGPLGTTKGLTPIVLYLSKKEVAALLDPATPQLALFAVWARCKGAGPEARRVARRAIELTEALPVELREAQSRAILAMLNERLLRFLREMAMDISQIKETKASRAFRLFFEKRGRKEGKAEGLAEGKAEGLAEGKAEGTRDALLAILSARGLAPTPAEREQIASVTDLAVLDRCIQSAVTAPTVAVALAPLQPRARRRAGAPSGPPARKRPNGSHR